MTTRIRLVSAVMTLVTLACVLSAPVRVVAVDPPRSAHFERHNVEPDKTLRFEPDAPKMRVGE